MIRIRQRGAEPELLAKRKKEWTARFQSNTKGRDWATKAAKACLRAGLLPLTHGKCALCESRLDKSDRTQIEHYHCKAIYRHLAFHWENLLPACAYCNFCKGDCDHQGTQIKPDAEDPELFFSIHPDTGKIEPLAGLPAADSARAEETIRLFKLNRDALKTSRKERLEELEAWISRWIKTGDPEVDTWERLSQPSSEYKLVLRSFLGLRDREELVDDDRRRYHA